MAPGNGKLEEPKAASGKPSIVEHLSTEEETATYALLMPSSFVPKEGEPLWEGVKLGKFLGAGAQAKVFQLAREDGKPTGKVIKVNHGGVGSKLLNNNTVWVGMDREWEVGNMLRSALQQPDGSVPGFMKVCDCLVTSGEKGAGFCGMIMGELHGWEVYKRILTPEFHNIHYVREMLFQVFSALDRGQSKLGFHHADLGMRNVMENYNTLWEDMDPEEAAKLKAQLNRPGYTVNADGSRFPLGPEIEFKIIDFGVAKFSPKLAAATAGPEAQAIVAELHEQLGKKERIVFSSEQEGTSLELEPLDVTQDQPGFFKLLLWNLTLPRSRMIVRKTAKAAAKGLVKASSKVAAGGSAIRMTASQETAYTKAEASIRKAKAEQKKKKSPIEAMYRHWWHRKGDVFHLLLGMALSLDDRVWPEEDEDLVQSLCSLVHHATGVKMRASFTSADAGPKVLGRHKASHWFRRWHIRAKSHIIPYNSGMLAREALSHPFFGTSSAKHADLPAKLSTAFPPPPK